ncbi:molybdenum cofactor biosynthesis protein [Aliidongia dinghuensis]|uniref:Molybdenum cofactor biosynthesis protein n=1 Tax=Aliidongia dinghuensis TaxID=1867774 RepID=A0A8J3E699_9PROT|nr:competence/damage-inducible protein A [Aliidongia dinghuensis]GGF39474.1 molybdenum cofactor biosynthesis protein [Aliidongia dinghuensis]
MTEPAPAAVTACLVIIGNEILSGRTQDINLNYIARGLTEVGVQLTEARVIPDVRETIIATINEVRAKYDYVFTTGGIGPTHDDITAECVAAAFGVDLILHPEAKRRLEAHYSARGIEFNEARRRMAHVPDGASLIDNPVSTAPGFRIGNVHVMAGVPKIMQAMFDGIRHGLKGGPKMLSRTITCGLAEGTVAHDLGLIQADYPAVEIGSYPFWTGGGGFGVSLVLRSTDPVALAHAGEAVIAMIRGFGGEPVEREPEIKE